MAGDIQTAGMKRSIKQPDDGTRELLRSGGWMVGAGVVAALLLETLLGGISQTGARTNGGWFAFIVAMMCIPFGLMLLSLGVAKWLRNRHIGRRLRPR